MTAALGVFWIAASVLIKLSILFFYRRKFVGRIFSVCNGVLIGLSIIWSIFAFLSWIIYCGTHLRANFEGGWAAFDIWGSDIQMGVVNCLDTIINFFLLVLPVSFVSYRSDSRPLMSYRTD